MNLDQAEQNLLQRWFIVIVSALTDGAITTGTAIMTAMAGAENLSIPSDGVLFTSILGGLVIALRTLQQHLKKFSEIDQ